MPSCRRSRTSLHQAQLPSTTHNIRRRLVEQRWSSIRAILWRRRWSRRTTHHRRSSRSFLRSSRTSRKSHLVRRSSSLQRSWCRRRHPARIPTRRRNSRHHPQCHHRRPCHRPPAPPFRYRASRRLLPRPRVAASSPSSLILCHRHNLTAPSTPIRRRGPNSSAA